MLNAQLREEELSHEIAIKDQKLFQARDIERRMASLRKALNKITASVTEKEYIPRTEFQLL